MGECTEFIVQGNVADLSSSAMLGAAFGGIGKRPVKALSERDRGLPRRLRQEPGRAKSQPDQKGVLP